MPRTRLRGRAPPIVTTEDRSIPDRGNEPHAGRGLPRRYRDAPIAKGMIWSPSHGDTAFTVPLFDEFMKRIIPAQESQRS